MRIKNHRERRGKTIVVVGAGGNIGSHLVPHLARMPGVTRVTLIDKDAYESANLPTQDITPRDVGKRKVLVQARRLRRINPKLRVEAIAEAVERVPLGKLRGDVMLACLDSRIARQHINQFAWRLGAPLIDAGVEASGLLARVNIYVPGGDAPCLECAWDDRDYAALEQTYPCAGFAPSTAATNAPSSLGGLAASLQAIECRKLLSGQTEQAAIGKQVLIDALHHKHYVTAFRRNAQCRFDHRVWQIRRLGFLPGEITLGQVFARLNTSSNGVPGLRIESKPFVKRLTCSKCGATRRVFKLEQSLTSRQLSCANCGERMIAIGFDLIERLNGESASSILGRSLGSLGIRPAEVLSVGLDRSESHFEVVAKERS